MIKPSKNLLDSLNLTDKQGLVYFAALSLGEGSMQDLSRRSGIKRTTIYTFIEALKEKGFLTETKRKKRKIYSAIDPDRLLEIQRFKMAELQSLIPELKAIYNKSSAKPKVTYHEGMDGIKEVYGDMLNDQKEILAYEDLEHMKKTMPRSFYNYFPAERARRRIPFKSISRNSVIAEEFTKNNLQLLRETKLIKSADFKTEINIYGSKVALMSFTTQPAFCVLIEDENIANTLRVAWNELWKRLN